MDKTRGKSNTAKIIQDKVNYSIPVYQPDLSGNELVYVTDCITSSWISSLGEYIPRFEEAFAAFCGVRHAIAIDNGTAALHLALALYDIGPGDEVIVPTLTFVATANAVHYTGATPVFVDSESESWGIDPAAIETKISPKTRAIIPVHLFGHPANMGPIMALAQKYNLIVIEDAAEAHGAEYKGQRVGGIGQVGCFSFYGNKVLTTGEGGMLTTNDADVAKKARLLKDHGMSKEIRYWHPVVGYNYRMTNIQAALGLAQLERIDHILARKRRLAEIYHTNLADCPGIIRPPEADWAKNIYWLYTILITNDLAVSRDDVARALKQRGIDSRPVFIPMHQLPPYQDTANAFPVAENLSQQGLSLPSYLTLSDNQLNFICNTLREIICTSSRHANL